MSTKAASDESGSASSPSPVADQQLLLLYTLTTIFSSLAALIAFRQMVTLQFTRRIDVFLVLLIAWLVWTLSFVFFSRSAMRSAPQLFGVLVNRLITTSTTVFSIIFYFYCDDMIKHTTLVSGMTPAETFVVIVLTIMSLATVQTLFGAYAIFDLIPRASSLPQTQKDD